MHFATFYHVQFLSFFCLYYLPEPNKLHLFVLNFIKLFLKQHIANTDSFWVILIKSLVGDNKEKTFYHFLNCKYLHLAERKVNHLSMYDWSLRWSLNWIFPGKQNFWVKKSSKMGQEQKNWISHFFSQYYQRFISARGNEC